MIRSTISVAADSRESFCVLNRSKLHTKKPGGIGTGRYIVLGTTAGKPGLFFSYDSSLVNRATLSRSQPKRVKDRGKEARNVVMQSTIQETNGMK
jgi:hypothetical protein